MRRLVALGLTACWTGPAQPAQPTAATAQAAPVRKLTVKLSRTPCLGTCPSYTLVIHGDGRVEWDGHGHVAEVGHRERRVGPLAIERLDRTIERVRFFERDEYGQLPTKPNCTTTGTTTSCSFDASFTICSDTSHSIITVMRDGETHKIDNAHCGSRDPIDDLEDDIDRITRIDEWIGS